MEDKRWHRPPQNYNKIQRGSWYVGIVLGVVLLCVVLGAIIGIIIAGIRWIAIS